MRDILWVALGSVARWALTGIVQRWATASFPWGTLVVNVTGSLVIGILAAVALERVLVAPAVRLFLIVGVLGGFTTFSAFSYETVAMLREGQWLPAVAYAGGSVVGGVAAAFAGLAVGLRI